MIAALAAVWLIAAPARLPGDPAAPTLPPVPERGVQEPAPLSPPPPPLPPPIPATPTAAAVAVPNGMRVPTRLTPSDMRRMSIVPTAALGSAIVVPMALGARNGDWGTPATELLAGYGGGYLGTIAAVAITGTTEALGPRPDAKLGFSRTAAWVAVVGLAILPPAATGLAVFHAGEGMQGPSRHRTQNLIAAMGGAVAGELLFAGSAIAMRQPPGPVMTLLFIPMAAGATLAYDLARGPHRGPKRAMFPVVTFRF